MTSQQSQFLAFVKQMLDRHQPPKAICDLCGAHLDGWEAGETERYGEMVPNHQCALDERTGEIFRRTWTALTGDPMRTRAKGYAVR